MSIEAVQEILVKDERTPWLNIHRVYDEMPLTVEAFRLLCHLSRRSDNKDGLCRTSYRKIGEACFRASYPKSSPEALMKRAMRASAELKGYGLLRVKPNFADGLGQTSNTFILTHTSEWTLGYEPGKSTNVRGVDRSGRGGDVGTPPSHPCPTPLPSMSYPQDTGGIHKVFPLEGDPLEGRECPPEVSDRVQQTSLFDGCLETRIAVEAEADAHSQSFPPKEKSSAKKEKPPTDTELLAEFEAEFWLLKPKKVVPGEEPPFYVVKPVSKGDAEVAYIAARRGTGKHKGRAMAKDDLIEAWAIANSIWAAKVEAEKSEKQYIPYPARWLNARRWDDEDIQSRLDSASPESIEQDEAEVKKAIAVQQRRLGINGQLPKEWKQKTGRVTVGELSLEQLHEYLKWMKEQKDGSQ